MRRAVIGMGVVAVLAVPAVAQAVSEQTVGHTVHVLEPARVGDAKGHGGGGRGPANLSYRGGALQSAPQAYVVYWGSQWNGNDPSGEAAYLENFLRGVGTGETWSRSTTQYCQGVAFGTVTCPATTPASSFAGQPAQAFAASWSDDQVVAPSHPTQSQLAAEATKAAAHFNVSGANVQIVVATAHNNNASGFGTQYCAWHSSTSTSSGTLAYTNLPYMTDAGGSCGANFVSGLLDGVSIVEGHEYAETVTDPFPNSGWLDGSGGENADKCAWISPGLPGGAAALSLATGSFPVQALWSNNFPNANGTKGACAIGYTSATNQQQ